MPIFATQPAQKQQLLKDGYIHLQSALPETLLERWRNLAARLEQDALRAHARSDALHGACVIEDPVGPRLMRFDDVLAVDPEAVLDLLACPAMMAVAREFGGEGTVPVQMDILYKQQHPHPVVLWHQGAQHPRGYPYLNVGVYLDDALEGDGCLRYVPGTQHELQDICGLSAQYGWDIPGTIEQPARAGDILIQDMMILHGSQPKLTSGVRRTIYIELRPVAGIQESEVYSREWIELRKRWMALVLQRTESGHWPDRWLRQLPRDPGTVEDVVMEIMARREAPIPAVYCHQPIVTKDYPVNASASASGDKCSA
ncbi:hypothetical protein ACH42_10390 [Endozoicomonas sp. (ex Bugula neritina AB1)]|nr:hypothetical protein ACH42_10390 [Endozoicomonas sp. (ex Bugula neritina AB1)]